MKKLDLLRSLVIISACGLFLVSCGQEERHEVKETKKEVEIKKDGEAPVKEIEIKKEVK
jgi:hypothetical protein